MQGLSLFFSAFIVALVVQWKLALIVMSVVPAIVVIVGGCIGLDAPVEARIVCEKRLLRHRNKLLTSYIQVRIYSRAAVLAQDAISSIKTIHAFGAEQKIIRKYNDYLESAHQEGNKKSILFGVLFSGQTFVVMSGTALAFWQGFRMFANGEIDNVGTVFTVVLSVVLGATSVMLVIPQLQAITNASSAASELFSIIDRQSLLDPLSDEGLKPELCQGEVQISDLEFSYPSRPAAHVLQGLSLTLPAGKTTALVGPSGCGKSTIIGLLEKWYQPLSGQILLDGVPIAECNTAWLRSTIRLVQQEPVLFQGTIFENIANGLVYDQRDLPHEAKLKLVKEACIASNAHDFIEAFPQGYETQVGERASMLSGGQRQRLSIARSIVSNPKILLLDEATSALDPRAEMVVQDALNRVSADKTTLIIAHKLATVMTADNIAVMSGGKIVEQGTHSDLLKFDGLYAAMVRAQDLSAGTRLDDLSHEPAETTNSNETCEALNVPTRTLSEDTPRSSDITTEHLVAGTIGYSLLKCIWIMLKEHSDLYVWYAIIVSGALIGGGTYPAQAVIFSRLINVFTLQGQEARDRANFWALMFFVLAIANFVAFFSIGWACNKISQILTHRIRREMFERMISFDQDFFDRPENSSGSVTSKLASEPTSLQELMSGNLGLMLNVLINIASSSALGVAYGWKLGLVIAFGGLPPLVAAGYVRIRLEQRLEAAIAKQFARTAGFATEAVTSMRTVSFLTLETTIMNRYNEALSDIATRVIPSLALTLLPYALSQSMDFLIMALGFWYGSRLLVSGEYTTEQFFVIFIAVVFGGQAAGQFFSYTSSITKAKSSANYIFWLRTITPSIRETPQNRGSKPGGNEKFRVQDVHFEYKQRNASKVLQGISMDIEPGTRVAIVGPSGCGKSTIVSLLERFYDPSSGYIELGSERISHMSPRLYRRYMSLVQQEPPLYLGSVRENIAIGLDYEPSEAELHDACRQANALEFVMSLPEGLDTPCGSKGSQFSGGQRQRIAVARALIRKPHLLLLDEATSALDTHSERIVQQALDEAASSRTTIAIAHRLSTIRHSDIIYVMQDGRIVEKGTHEDLQQLRGTYFAMCLAQSLDQAT